MHLFFSPQQQTDDQKEQHDRPVVLLFLVVGLLLWTEEQVHGPILPGLPDDGDRAVFLRFTISACRFRSMPRTCVLSSFDILPCPGGRPSGFGLKMKKRLRELSSSFLFPLPVSFGTSGVHPCL